MNTQDLSPLCSPLCISLKDNIGLVKSKESIKRVLCYNENEKIQPSSKNFTAIDQVDENRKICEELKEELINMQKQEVCLDIETIPSTQNMFAMGYSYDPYMYSSWEKELDPDNFKKRLQNSSFSQGTTIVKEEEEQFEEHIGVYHRYRTLSSMFK